MKIHLPKGKYFLVDKEFIFLNEYKWCLRSGYPSRVIQINQKKYCILLHHVIMGKPLNGLVIDHINGNKLDNRQSNLRIVTWRENAQNRTIFREGNKTSKFFGVCLPSKNKKYVSYIRINGKSQYLGSFASQEEASQSYQKAVAANCLKKRKKK